MEKYLESIQRILLMLLVALSAFIAIVAINPNGAFSPHIANLRAIYNTVENKKIQKEIDQYTEEFVEDYNKYYTGKKEKLTVEIIKEKFGMELAPIHYYYRRYYIGVCITTSNKKYIRFNNVWWNGYATKLEKKYLVYHELGHCLLGKEHNIDFMGDEQNCPVSIMYPSNFDDFCIEDYEEYYLRELFTVE